MYTGCVIDELVGMVRRAEANAASDRMAMELRAQTRVPVPTFNIYDFEEFRNLERDYSHAGAA